MNGHGAWDAQRCRSLLVHLESADIGPGNRLKKKQSAEIGTVDAGMVVTCIRWIIERRGFALWLVAKTERNSGCVAGLRIGAGDRLVPGKRPGIPDRRHSCDISVVGSCAQVRIVVCVRKLSLRGHESRRRKCRIVAVFLCGVGRGPYLIEIYIRLRCSNVNALLNLGYS